jgi:hypothetical protein
MIAKGSGYNRGDRQAGRARLVAHLKYIEHRSRTENESRDDRLIFGEDEDVVNRKDAVNDVMSPLWGDCAAHSWTDQPL